MELKERALVMLLRNIDVSSGLCIPSLFLTVSALYRCIIGDSSENFPIAIEFITSQ